MRLTIAASSGTLIVTTSRERSWVQLTEECSLVFLPLAE